MCYFVELLQTSCPATVIYVSFSLMIYKTDLHSCGYIKFKKHQSNLLAFMLLNFPKLIDYHVIPIVNLS